MLNPPLSLLSDDLLSCIVEQLANLFDDEYLKNLSLADRAFTQCCQKYIFRALILGNDFRNISKQLRKKKKFLDNKPSFTNRVRMVDLDILSEKSASVFKDPNFTSILQLFAKSPMPPHKFKLGGISTYLKLLDPMLFVRQLAVSFFSQTLTILHVTDYKSVPIPLFLICPKLREVVLDHVGATGKRYGKYPDNQCFGREAPLLEVFKFSTAPTCWTREPQQSTKPTRIFHLYHSELYTTETETESATYFTYWSRDIHPFPPGQVRGRCRR